MLSLRNFLTSSFVFFCVINGGLFKELPDYIHVCKRDPNTINECVLKSIEMLKPKLIQGIPEIDVPPIDPFIISNTISLRAEGSQVGATAHDIKVSGASDYIVKSLSVDLDTLKIKFNVFFKKLQLEGAYKLDTIAVLPALKLDGDGNFTADAVKCNVEMTLHTKVYNRDGVDYIKFEKIDSDINIKDYRITLDGLFNGDKVLGDAANQIIYQNRREFLKEAKPHLLATINGVVLGAANKVVEDIPANQLMPLP